jgi:Ca-activated chloride channel family protein
MRAEASTSMRIETDRARIPASAESVRYLTVHVTAPGSDRRSDRTPANVALVLDRSGSMDGRKIEMARAAVGHAIRLLDSRDRLAVVVYDTDVDVVLESTSATSEAKSLALKRLAGVEARGGTDLSAGWARGAGEVARQAPAPDADGTARVLLLTDGLANAGMIDHDALVRMAAAFRAKGIRTSTFGLGADFDELLLARLSTEGGGNFYFIETPRQIPDFLASELGETLDVVAPDAEFVIRGGPAVEIAALNDFPAEAKADGLHVKLGDLVAGQDVHLVVALRWQPRPDGSAAVADCRLTDKAGTLFPQPMRVEWTTADLAANDAQPVNPAVLVAAAELIAARATAAALAANRAGRFDEATSTLRNAAASLRAMANGIPEIVAIADKLDAERPTYTVEMNQMTVKTRHFAAYSRVRERDEKGRARKAVSR